METAMRFTPAFGMLMSTRAGDLDPGAIVYLLKGKGMDAFALNLMVNKEAWLLGMSSTSSDLKDLLDKELEDLCVAQAVDSLC
jgi:acetate kinase